MNLDYKAHIEYVRKKHGHFAALGAVFALMGILELEKSLKERMKQKRIQTALKIFHEGVSRWN